MVSFIIPAYNCENYIRECIESILYQDDPSFEILIINDGSTDETHSILKEYSELDTRIRVFNVNNGGPSKARNIGLDNARGEWIIFVDSDDWVDKDILTRLELFNSDNPDIVFWGFRRCFDNNTSEICVPQQYPTARDDINIYNQLLYLIVSKEEYFGYSWNKIYKQSIIQKYHIRFNEDLSVREDELFALTYCCHIQSIKIINYTPYNYRFIQNSLSHNANLKYRNYYLLAQNEAMILSSLQESNFKDALAVKIFKYYLTSIEECLLLKSYQIDKALNAACSFYDNYNRCFDIPKWQTAIFHFPIKSFRKKLVLNVFKFRLKIKKKL